MFLKLIKKFNKSSNIINNIENTIDYKIRSNQLLVDAKTLTSPLTSKLIDGSRELIVSFTTYSKRIHDVHLVIESIAQQTVKPNRLILWLDEDEFSLDTIPLIIHKQIDRGLEVRFCPNYRSYKKLIPALKEFPEANIITIDDDVLYPHDMIELLYKEHKDNPECIIGHRAHKITFTANAHIQPYRKWHQEINSSEVHDCIFFTGVGGIMYPSNSLEQRVLSTDVFMSICPNADDVWFKAMALLNGTKSKKVDDSRDFSSRFLLLENSQDIALGNSNVIDNDAQIEAVFKKYDLYERLL